MADVGAAIEIRRVGQRSRSGAETLRDVSLSVGHGELVAIVGGSDSGASALLEVMGGIRQPVSGTVAWSSPGHIGYVANIGTLASVLPLSRALGYTAALRDLPRTAVGEALAAAGLAGRAGVPVGRLTAAERGRASVAGGLLGGPGLICLDNPASGLDPASAAGVLRLLRDLAGAGTAVVLTAHHPADAERADKVAVLASGHLAFFGSPASARDYFGADGMHEICERLAGVGDPAAAWSRRYARFHRTDTPDSPSSPHPHPHSRPHPSPHRHPQAHPDEWPIATPMAVAMGHSSPTLAGRRQAVLLALREGEVLGRGWRGTAGLLAGPPLAAMMALAVLFRSGGGGDPLLWVAFTGFFSGLAWALPSVFPSALSPERPRAGPCLLAKAAVLLPPLAVADAVFLALLGLAGGWPGFGRYGQVYLTLLLCSTAALGLGLLVSASVPPRLAATALPVAVFPLLLAAFGVAQGHAGWPAWLWTGIAAVALWSLAMFAVSAAVGFSDGH